MPPRPGHTSAGATHVHVAAVRSRISRISRADDWTRPCTTTCVISRHSPMNHTSAILPLPSASAHSHSRIADKHRPTAIGVSSRSRATIAFQSQGLKALRARISACIYDAPPSCEEAPPPMALVPAPASLRTLSRVSGPCHIPAGRIYGSASILTCARTS
ncbi:hypothetical protein BC834DRAFT_85676 [Gloeopeniophorella convolvens]|nr:hypothetical protein BC834DRAFT_85676 [Gloeopeniophorella convolvens]